MLKFKNNKIQGDVIKVKQIEGAHKYFYFKVVRIGEIKELLSMDEILNLIESGINS